MANALQTAKQNIINAIIANGNEEITADVLRPLLTAICDAALSITGDPDNLNTTANSNLVNAINELKAITDNLTGVVILTGNSDPNVTSPANASLGNYYARYSGSTLISFWIFNGYEWIEIKSDPNRKEIKTISDTTYTLLESDNDKILQFTSATDVTITVPAGLTVGNRYEGKQRGTGQLIFVDDGTTVINIGASETNKTLEQFSVWGLDCCDTDDYDLFGKLELI